MKSLIVYSSPTQLSPLHRFVQSTRIDEHGEVRPLPAGEHASFYVRAEVFEGDVSDALDAANPLKGETVLNTIPLE